MKEFFWVEEIAVGACISLKNMRGWRIECEIGQVWVTEMGLAHDVFVAQVGAHGQPAYEIQQQTQVVIQSMPGLSVVARLHFYPPTSIVQRIRRLIGQRTPTTRPRLGRLFPLSWGTTGFTKPA